MQATGSLSFEQRATIEGVCLLLLTTRTFLDGMCSEQKLDAVHRLELQSAVQLLQLHEERLLAQFPELEYFAEQWKKQGVSRG
jgi:hypothetical protein